MVANIACEVLCIHKSQIQTFAIDKHFVERVKNKAAIYPGDPTLVVSLYKSQEWKRYRKEVVEGINKDRWPIQAENHEPFKCY